MKEYLMLIRQNQDNSVKMTPEQMQEDIAKHVNWVRELVQNGNFKGGNPLMPMGKQLKGNSKIVTDGPYIESKECVSGYYFLLAPSLEEATEIAKGCPTLSIGGTVELREIILIEKM
ncbi:MAG: YciI family protein [Bacteroidota bacterium]